MARYKKEQCETAKVMIRNGKGSTEIGEVTGLSRSTICQLARELGVTMPRTGCKKPTPMSTFVCDNCLKEFRVPVRIYRNERRRRAKKSCVPDVGTIGKFCSQQCFRQHQGWSSSDIKYLRRWYREQRHKDIAIALGKTVGAVSTKACALGLRKLFRATVSDLAFIFDNLQTRNRKEIADELEWPIHRVHNAIKYYRMNRKLRFSEEERRTIKRLYRRGYSDLVISRRLKVHYGRVYRYRKKKGWPNNGWSEKSTRALIETKSKRRDIYQSARRRVNAKISDAITGLVLDMEVLTEIAAEAIADRFDGDDALSIAWEGVHDAWNEGIRQRCDLIHAARIAVKKFDKETVSWLSLEGIGNEEWTPEFSDKGF